MKPKKQKNCTICGGLYYPYSSLSTTCGIACSIDDVRRKQQKKADREALRIVQDNKRDIRVRKEALKSKSDWIRLAQIPCNAYIRKRDSVDGCISCNKPSTWGGQWHASHYRPAGNCSPLRFHPMNIHKSCSECNNFKSGNLSEFRIKLIGKIGIEMVEWLESQNHPYQWDIEDIKEIAIYYRDQINLLA